MPREIKHIRDFVLMARRDDAKCKCLFMMCCLGREIRIRFSVVCVCVERGTFTRFFFTLSFPIDWGVVFSVYDV